MSRFRNRIFRIAANASELFCMAYLGNIERFLYHFYTKCKYFAYIEHIRKEK